MSALKRAARRLGVSSQRYGSFDEEKLSPEALLSGEGKIFDIAHISRNDQTFTPEIMSKKSANGQDVLPSFQVRLSTEGVAIMSYDLNDVNDGHRVERSFSLRVVHSFGLQLPRTKMERKMALPRIRIKCRGSELWEFEGAEAPDIYKTLHLCIELLKRELTQSGEIFQYQPAVSLRDDGRFEEDNSPGGRMRRSRSMNSYRAGPAPGGADFAMGHDRAGSDMAGTSVEPNTPEAGARLVTVQHSTSATLGPGSPGALPRSGSHPHLSQSATWTGAPGPGEAFPTLEPPRPASAASGVGLRRSHTLRVAGDAAGFGAAAMSPGTPPPSSGMIRSGSAHFPAAVAGAPHAPSPVHPVSMELTPWAQAMPATPVAAAPAQAIQPCPGIPAAFGQVTTAPTSPRRELWEEVFQEVTSVPTAAGPVPAAAGLGHPGAGPATDGAPGGRRAGIQPTATPTSLQSATGVPATGYVLPAGLCHAAPDPFASMPVAGAGAPAASSTASRLRPDAFPVGPGLTVPVVQAPVLMHQPQYLPPSATGGAMQPPRHFGGAPAGGGDPFAAAWSGPAEPPCQTSDPFLVTPAQPPAQSGGVSASANWWD
ncbi:hypothetical protein H696_01094 [Fonticula alba]|uniref:Uncharacterized protein n=1 Tax=Fonticula alba TaxID=691883 RepID=A0A058ZDY8_FONAL|nr:hypothetical protein H696_01094 [Fonticula alba]KCV71677.1 hypothetical protein H696_01094 [Fonticula alba]|eukprot:XP_009493255.1 hypothetical protein H696_01094 [Fonticula alba]